MIEWLSDARRAALKASFVTRRAPRDAIAGLIVDPPMLRPGDLVIAEVLEIGHHTKIEQPNGRRAMLYPGDEILVACGARYAPDQFEALCPASVGPAHLVAAGGIAGAVIHAHEKMRPATEIRILGAAATAAGVALNLADFALPFAPDDGFVPVLGVVGTSMNAGKTHAVSSIVRGLRAAGRRVAALKATGTGAGGDLWRQLDAGADMALDFTDAGFATTYQEDPMVIESGLRRLLKAAEAEGVDMAVVEFADGLRQDETAALLASEALRRRMAGVVFAAGDALGAERGVAELQRLRHRVAAVGGLLTRSPLMIRETSRSVTPPVLSAEQLADPATAIRLFADALHPRFTLPPVADHPPLIAAPAMQPGKEIADVA